MYEPKPLASLSSGLLARKGQARPAMRPQGFIDLKSGAMQDDLGWNDMGEDSPAPAPQPVIVPARAPIVAPKPAVLRQIEALDEQMAQPAPAPAPAAQPAPAPVAARPAPKRASVKAPIRAAADGKAKTAFTLRLDNDRHLRLRLASAVTNRSAQLLVTQALDRFLETLTEVETLARQVDQAPNHG
jgi:hypothetical protein